MSNMWRSRWAAVGAAVAITLGAGGMSFVDAAKGSGERAVYTAIEPCRLLDTRPNQNIQRNTPLGEGETYDVTAIGDNGQCEDIPADTVALELNVTGLLNTAATDFVVWSGAGAAPNASHINLALGAPPTPNSVTTELDGNSFSIRNKFGNAHVIVDIVGVYQDHHHDDRYYTETESDEKYLAKSQDSHAAVWSANESIALTTADQVIGSVTIDTPTSGYVILNSGGYVVSSGQTRPRCSITTGTEVDTSALVISELNGSVGTDVGYLPIGTTRSYTINFGLFPIQSAEKTYNLVCDTGTVAGATLVDPQLNATFIPDPDAFSTLLLPSPDEAPADPVIDGLD